MCLICKRSPVIRIARRAGSSFRPLGDQAVKQHRFCSLRVVKQGVRALIQHLLVPIPRWPYQPYQVFDMNSERVALQRRFPPDDQFVVPHNLLLTMFSPSSVNVVAFDQLRGADHARAYATKYCSKPEKWHLHHLNRGALV